ncbi:Heat shock protein 70 family [Cinnamomum micranthum f. kanehirae]|uniref:Heat shock protein 70 family n=1 Tax=Cinnamomum micranthum f. kanehirae TaxID=337451 RepID=A0A3S3NPY9_9MAGN|nr:Heat shock protein 70 family [Cinnamomum micranthum f. kanehirae]
MSVVGFDIGNENCVIAVAKQRGIDVLLNDESKRETPAVVSFGDKQRFLGSAGAASATMNPKSTISQVKRLIGRDFSHPDVQEELRRLPFETLEGPGGEILVLLQYIGETHTFTPVQILAMLFAHLKHTAEKNLGTSVSDCVIGIPAYFTDFQRQAYLNAAAIAGLKPLRLMHDCTATALGYGIYKTDYSNSGPINVVFVDVGHCDTQVCVASFESGHMKILSHASDHNLGGRDFDEVLFDHFAAEFKERYHIDVRSNVRACTRLRAACEKLKKVLSANAEAPINIECLIDEKDVRGFIKRDEFEELSSGLLERIAVPCYKALADSHLNMDNIHSVELVGSGSRIPAIMRRLASLFRREPSRTLNASECVARGCALQCAMLSPIFRVRDYEVQDSFPYSIGFASDEGPICTLSNSILFPKGQSIPSVKILTFHRTNTFRLEAFYGDQSELPSGVSPKISCFTIGPFQAHTENSKAKVRVKLNLHGIVTVESASLIEDEAEEPVSRATNSHSDEVEPEFVSKVSSDSGANGAETENCTPSKADGKRKGRLSRRLEIPVTETIYGGMSEAELSDAQAKELKLAHQDRVMEQTKERRNALEAFIYETRDKLFNTYRSFATESEKEEVSSRLQRTEEWLYEDGDDESEKVYTEKLEELKELVDPIESRFRDDEARPQATRDLLKHIADLRLAVKSLATSDRDAVMNECSKAEQWLQEGMQLQNSLPKNVDPVLWSNEIRRMIEELDMKCRQRLRPMSFPTRPGESKDADRASTDDSMPPE